MRLGPAATERVSRPWRLTRPQPRARPPDHPARPLFMKAGSPRSARSAQSAPPPAQASSPRMFRTSPLDPLPEQRPDSILPGSTRHHRALRPFPAWRIRPPPAPAGRSSPAGWALGVQAPRGCWSAGAGRRMVTMLPRVRSPGLVPFRSRRPPPAGRSPPCAAMRIAAKPKPALLLSARRWPRRRWRSGSSPSSWSSFAWCFGSLRSVSAALRPKARAAEFLLRALT